MSVERQLAAYCEAQDELHPPIRPEEVAGSAVRVSAPVRRSTAVWWVAAAAAATALVIGGLSMVAGNRSSIEDVGEPLEGPYAVGRHLINVNGLPVSFDVPTSGWDSHGGFLISKDTIAPVDGAEVVVFFTTFPGGENVRLCPDLAPGQVPANSDIFVVADAFSSDMVEPTLVPWHNTLGGLPAKHLEFTVQEDIGCDPGFFYSWDTTLGPASWTESKVGDIIHVWLTNVDGRMLVVVAETHGSNVARDVTHEIYAIVDSIRFPSILRTLTADYTIDLDSGQRMLLPAAIRSSGPSQYAVSPDGTSLAYVAPDTYGSFQLFVASIDGSEIRQVTHPPAEVSSPAWSPDGTRVAFVESESLVVLDVASGESRRVDDVVPGWGIQFTPDGSSILTERQSNEDSDLVLVPINGGESTVLIGGEQGVGAAGGSLSPDGSRITFMGTIFRQPGPDRYLVYTDDPEPHGLSGLDARADCASNPSGTWSPDGTRIVCAGGRGVLVIDFATGEVSVVADGNGAVWLDDHTLLVEARAP
jgi:WD40-like Beta Propeller Repeat